MRTNHYIMVWAISLGLAWGTGCAEDAENQDPKDAENQDPDVHRTQPQAPETHPEALCS